MNLLRIASVGFVVACLASPVAAQVTTYTSQADFDAALSSETTFGFSEGNSSSHYHVADNPYTKLGISFASDTTAADIANNGTPIVFLVGKTSNPVYGKDFLAFQNSNVGITADITSSGVTALGFQYGSYIAPDAATISVNGGAPIALTPQSGGVLSFIGFVSTTPITDLSIVYPTGYTFDITSVSISPAAVSPLPETESWAMFIGGFGLVGGAMRRRRTTVHFA